VDALRLSTLPCLVARKRASFLFCWIPGLSIFMRYYRIENCVPLVQARNDAASKLTPCAILVFAKNLK
jgi:hypothetical protein